MFLNYSGIPYINNMRKTLEYITNDKKNLAKLELVDMTRELSGTKALEKVDDENNKSYVQLIDILKTKSNIKNYDSAIINLSYLWSLYNDKFRQIKKIDLTNTISKQEDVLLRRLKKYNLDKNLDVDFFTYTFKDVSEKNYEGVSEETKKIYQEIKERQEFVKKWRSSYNTLMNFKNKSHKHNSIKELKHISKLIEEINNLNTTIPEFYYLLDLCNKCNNYLDTK